MFTSQMTFMYFTDMVKARVFFEDFLKLTCVFDPGWAKVYQTAQGAFLGAVDMEKGSFKPEVRSGTLVSLTVKDIEIWHAEARGFKVEALTDIKDFLDLGLKSFFFKGPDGYDFEIQCFQTDGLSHLF